MSVLVGDRLPVGELLVREPIWVGIRVPTDGVPYARQLKVAAGNWSSKTDDFPGTSITFGPFWEGSYGAYTVGGNRLGMTTVGYQGLHSNEYDLVDQVILWKNEPDTTGGYAGGTLRRAGGATTVLTMFFKKGAPNTLEIEYSNGGSTSVTSITYSATDHLWFRFRYSSTTGMLYAETAPDGVIWTTRRSITVPLPQMRGVDLQLEAGEFPSAGTGTAYFSKLNLPPTPGPVALSGTSAGSSTSTGALTLAEALTGTSTGTSTGAASLVLAEALTGTSAGTSTSAASQLTNVVLLDGTSAGSSTSTAALTLALVVAGTSAGTSTSTASLDLGQGLTGSSAGASTSAASLVLGLAVTGTTSGVATSAGALTITRYILLDGASNGVATSSATTLTLERALQLSAWRYVLRGYSVGVIERAWMAAVLVQAWTASDELIQAWRADSAFRAWEAKEPIRES